MFEKQKTLSKAPNASSDAWIVIKFDQSLRERGAGDKITKPLKPKRIKTNPILMCNWKLYQIYPNLVYVPTVYPIQMNFDINSINLIL